MAPRSSAEVPQGWVRCRDVRGCSLRRRRGSSGPCAGPRGDDGVAGSWGSTAPTDRVGALRLRGGSELVYARKEVDGYGCVTGDRGAAHGWGREGGAQLPDPTGPQGGSCVERAAAEDGAAPGGESHRADRAPLVGHPLRAHWVRGAYVLDRVDPPDGTGVDLPRGRSHGCTARRRDDRHGGDPDWGPRRESDAGGQ